MAAPLSDKRSMPYMRTDDTLTEVQEKAIEMLTSGKYLKKEIAAELGIHRETLRKWMKRDDFAAALREVAEDKKRQTIDFINSKAYEAAVEYWKLCTQTTDKRTKEKALASWLDRCIGKPSQHVQFEDKREVSDDYDIQGALQELKNQQDNSPVILPFEKVG